MSEFSGSEIKPYRETAAEFAARFGLDTARPRPAGLHQHDDFAGWLGPVAIITGFQRSGVQCRVPTNDGRLVHVREYIHGPAPTTRAELLDWLREGLGKVATTRERAMKRLEQQYNEATADWRAYEKALDALAVAK